jgi:NAD+ diphosphatase
MPFIKKSETPGKYCFIFQDKNIFLKKDYSLPDFADLKNLDYFTDTEFSYTCAMFPPEKPVPEKFISIPLRQYFSSYDEEKLFLSARAHSILLWRTHYNYCPVCGGLLIDDEKFSARKCKKCEKLIFPRVEPCIIVLVKKGKQMLLVKNVNPNVKFYACVAGFIEAGESAEHAVEREVFEETGIKVKNIKYKGSQGWPFPDQLMLAFTADYAGGEISLQKEELCDGGWFSPEDTVSTPLAGSVAYRLIHDVWD